MAFTTAEKDQILRYLGYRATQAYDVQLVNQQCTALSNASAAGENRVRAYLTALKRIESEIEAARRTFGVSSAAGVGYRVGMQTFQLEEEARRNVLELAIALDLSIAADVFGGGGGGRVRRA